MRSHRSPGSFVSSSADDRSFWTHLLRAGLRQLAPLLTPGLSVNQAIQTGRGRGGWERRRHHGDTASRWPLPVPVVLEGEVSRG